MSESFGGPTSNLDHTSLRQLIKRAWKKEAGLPSIPLASFLTGIRAYFIGTLAYTKDHLRRSASWTEQFPDFQTLAYVIAIVGIVRPQPVNHSNKSHLHRDFIFIFVSMSMPILIYMLPILIF